MSSSYCSRAAAAAVVAVVLSAQCEHTSAAFWGTEEKAETTDLKEVLEQIKELRREQADLRERLDQCGCKAKGSSSLDSSDSSSSSDSEEVFTQTASVQDWKLQKLGEEDGPVFKIDAQNSGWLREVMFGGQPWIVHCMNYRSSVKVEPPEVFSEAAQEFTSLASFGLVDCWERLPSGKTLAQRFNFPKPPVAFAVANGDPPVVIDLQGMSKPWQLKRKAAPALAASVERIASPESFKSYCTNRQACVVISFRTAKQLGDVLEVINPVLQKQRGVRAVSVDSSVWKLKLDERLMATRKQKPGSGGKNKTHADLVCLGRRDATVPKPKSPKSGLSRMGSFLEHHSGIPNINWHDEAQELDKFITNCASASGEGQIYFSSTPKLLPRLSGPQTGSASGKASRSSKPSSKSSSKVKREGGGFKTKKEVRGSKASKQKDKRGQGKEKTDGKKDFVGSRERLEQQDEPIVSDADDGDEGPDAEVDDDAEETVEL
eukprot:TRINITY_DN35493_c0_g1_i1.p1 TRINITY_DN35493_c0_g1~~TRINITY_DN35493_c0_g1_i1.p1  ORF type:complete len:489 (+),score=117.96 TRINITY_DN35493_c0_g1_i1:47-1513(+)